MQLENVTSGAVVAVDVESRDPRPAENACAVSASFHVDACARNTFTFEPYVPRTAKAAAMLPTYDDDILHYGQKVKLVVNPAAIEGSDWDVATCRLKSFTVSQTHFAKFSRRCEVVASGNDSYECVFEVLTPDPAKRLVSEGVPVMAGAPIVLLHCQTNQCLSVPGPAFANDFGDELEVAGHTASGAGNAYVMQGLATGKPSGMTAKAPGDVNTFVIVAGER